MIASYIWWLGVLLLVMWPAVRRAVLASVLRQAADLRGQTTAMRRAWYFTGVGSKARDAKEVRVSGLAGFLAARYARQFTEAIRAGRAGLRGLHRRAAACLAAVIAGNALAIYVITDAARARAGLALDGDHAADARGGDVRGHRLVQRQSGDSGRVPSSEGVLVRRLVICLVFPARHGMAVARQHRPEGVRPAVPRAHRRSAVTGAEDGNTAMDLITFVTRIYGTLPRQVSQRETGRAVVAPAIKEG